MSDNSISDNDYCKKIPSDDFIYNFCTLNYDNDNLIEFNKANKENIQITNFDFVQNKITSWGEIINFPLVWGVKQNSTLNSYYFVDYFFDTSKKYSSTDEIKIYIDDKGMIFINENQLISEAESPFIETQYDSFAIYTVKFEQISYLPNVMKNWQQFQSPRKQFLLCLMRNSENKLAFSVYIYNSFAILNRYDNKKIYLYDNGGLKVESQDFYNQNEDKNVVENDDGFICYPASPIENKTKFTMVNNSTLQANKNNMQFWISPSGNYILIKHQDKYTLHSNPYNSLFADKYCKNIKLKCGEKYEQYCEETFNPTTGKFADENCNKYAIALNNEQIASDRFGNRKRFVKINPKLKNISHCFTNVPENSNKSFLNWNYEHQIKNCPEMYAVCSTSEIPSHNNWKNSRTKIIEVDCTANKQCETNSDCFVNGTNQPLFCSGKICTKPCASGKDDECNSGMKCENTWCVGISDENDMVYIPNLDHTGCDKIGKHQTSEKSYVTKLECENSLPQKWVCDSNAKKCNKTFGTIGFDDEASCLSTCNQSKGSILMWIGIGILGIIIGVIIYFKVKSKWGVSNQ